MAQLNWGKDRRRQLTKRAAAEEIEDWRKKRASRASQKRPAHRSKQADRELADKIAREYKLGIAQKLETNYAD